MSPDMKSLRVRIAVTVVTPEGEVISSEMDATEIIGESYKKPCPTHMDAEFLGEEVFRLYEDAIRRK